MGRGVMTCASNGDVVYCEFDFDDYMDIEEKLDNERYYLKQIIPSLEDALWKRKWKYNECRLIAENGLYKVYVSYYGNIMAYSFYAKAEDDEAEWSTIGLANYRMEMDAKKLSASLGDSALRRVGTFSNGESVYESC